MKNLLIRIAIIVVTASVVVAIMQPMMNDIEFDAGITKSSLSIANAELEELRKVNSDLRFKVLNLENEVNDFKNSPTSIDDFFRLVNTNRSFANILGGGAAAMGLILGFLFGLSMRRKSHAIEIQKIEDHVNFLNKEKARHLNEIAKAKDELAKSKDDYADVLSAFENLQKARRG